jgi:hypothetical protein
MKKHFSNFIILVIAVGAIFWLGALNIRALVGNELFETDVLQWKNNLSPDFYSAYFRIIAMSSILTLISYTMVLMFTIIYLVYVKPDLKANGWLMASLIFFFLFMPVEVYTSYYDFRFVYEYFFASADYYYLKELLTKRITALSGLPVIAIFCYYTIVGLIIWKPMKKNVTVNN